MAHTENSSTAPNPAREHAWDDNGICQIHGGYCSMAAATPPATPAREHQARVCENALVALADLGPQAADVDALLAALLPHLTSLQRLQRWAPIANAERDRRLIQSGQIPAPRGRRGRAEQEAAARVRYACALAADADQQAARAHSYAAGVR